MKKVLLIVFLVANSFCDAQNFFPIGLTINQLTDGMLNIEITDSTEANENQSCSRTVIQTLSDSTFEISYSHHSFGCVFVPKEGEKFLKKEFKCTFDKNKVSLFVAFEHNLYGNRLYVISGFFDSNNQFVFNGVNIIKNNLRENICYIDNHDKIVLATYNGIRKVVGPILTRW